jgi:hypothetical protein
MQEEHQFDRGLTDLEHTLKALAPAPAQLSIAQTMYLAGRQSMRQQQRWQRVWPLSSACLAVLSLTLAVLLATPRQPHVVNIVREPVPQSQQEQDSSSAQPPQQLAKMHSARKAHSDGLQRLTAPAKFDRLARRNLALLDKWDAVASESEAEQAPIHAIRSRDWHLLLDNMSAADQLQRPDATPSPLFPWTALLNLQG